MFTLIKPKTSERASEHRQKWTLQTVNAQPPSALSNLYTLHMDVGWLRRGVRPAGLKVSDKTACPTFSIILW